MHRGVRDQEQVTLWREIPHYHTKCQKRTLQVRGKKTRGCVFGTLGGNVVHFYFGLPYVLLLLAVAII